MNSSFKALIGVSTAAVLLAAAPFAAAQQAAPSPAGPLAAKWEAHRLAREEARAHALHDVLNIRPDQEAAFKTFLEAQRPPPPPEGAGPEREHGEMARLTTPERLDRMAARMAEHQAHFRRHADAVKAFYAVLSPDQKRAFDALPGLKGGEGPGFGPPPGGPGHMGPGPMAMGGPPDEEGDFGPEGA